MRRTLFTAATVLSLLLLLAMIGCWIRSYQVGYTIDRIDGHGRIYSLASMSGGVYLSFGMRDPEGSSHMWFTHTGSTYPLELRRGIESRRWQGIQTYSFPGWPYFHGTNHVMIVSYWLLCLGFAIVPGVWGRNWLRLKSLQLIASSEKGRSNT